MGNRSVADLRNAFYGGGPDAEYAFYELAEQRGINAEDLLFLETATIGVTTLANASGNTLIGASDAISAYDITLVGNVTIELMDAVAAKEQIITIRLIQDGVGNRQVTWPPEVSWPNGIVPGLTTVPDNFDEIQLRTTVGNAWTGRVIARNIVQAVPPGLPSAPRDLVATLFSETEVELDWVKPLSNNPATTLYKVERRLFPNGTFAQIGTTSATVYNDTTVTVGNSYEYRVRANNTYGDSPYSNAEDIAVTAVTYALRCSGAAGTIAYVNDGGSADSIETADRFELRFLIEPDNWLGPQAVAARLYGSSLNQWIAFISGVDAGLPLTPTGGLAVNVYPNSTEKKFGSDEVNSGKKWCRIQVFLDSATGNTKVRFWHALGTLDSPAIGDWVAETDEQTLAGNGDLATALEGHLMVGGIGSTGTQLNFTGWVYKLELWYGWQELSNSGPGGTAPVVKTRTDFGKHGRILKTQPANERQFDAAHATEVPGSANPDHWILLGQAELIAR